LEKIEKKVRKIDIEISKIEKSVKIQAKNKHLVPLKKQRQSKLWSKKL